MKDLHQTPFPDITDLREWDLTLLKRYKPIFKKPVKTCSLCNLGPCKPSNETLGKCGIDEDAFKARYALLDAVIGASGHTSHARRLLTDLIKRFGRETNIDMGKEVRINTPIITLITGIEPKTIADTDDVIAYIENQLVHLLSSVSFGAEAVAIDFVSKTLHTGMLDNLAMEVCDIIQISAMNMPKGSSGGLINFGIETIDKNKFVVLIIGHNSVVGHDMAHLLKDKGIEHKFEICGLCCSAIDGSRHSHTHNFKIIGNQSMQTEVVKTGIADVVVLDTQCIRADIVETALHAGSIVITTAEESVMGIDDISDFTVDDMIDFLLKNKKGFIQDKKKVPDVIIKIRVKGQGSRVKGQGSKIQNSKFYLRIGRGPIRDSEIRSVAPSIIMGEIPGVVGIFGCPEERQGYGETETGRMGDKESPIPRFPDSPIHNLAEEFLKRGYIVSTGGCASIDVAKGDIFKKTSDLFDSGNLTNLGSCVSASHLIGACIKIANIMSHRNINGNYEEIADYIINRVGAVIILWGAFTQKAFATALGAARLGIPTIFGPIGKKYGLHLVGSSKEQVVMDARIGDEIRTSLSPENLLCSAETIEQAFALATKLAIRANDTAAGRKIKLKNYIELYKKANTNLPPDIHLFIRTNYDIPQDFDDEIQRHLTTTNWQPSYIPDPTFLKRMKRGEVCR
ncbi:MAG: hypothetical protein HZB79_06735 [Deltaproteobacteria bacterium]|nr:hypothetical protein [Deltaproteobacteria bacterium]